MGKPNRRMEPLYNGIWRPSVERLVAYLARLHEMPLEELMTFEVLERCRAALALPLGEVFGTRLFWTVPEQVAAVTTALLSDPAIDQECERVALMVARTMTEANLHIWTVDHQTATAKFRAERARSEISESCAEWIRARVERPGGHKGRRRRRGDDAMRLFDPESVENWRDEVDELHIRVSGPGSLIPADQLAAWDRLGREIREGLKERFLEERFAPAVNVQPWRSSEADFTLSNNTEEFLASRSQMLSSVDALIVTDFAKQLPSLEAASDIEHMLAVGGIVIFLEDPQVQHARHVLGRSEEGDISILRIDDPDELADLAIAAITDRFDSIVEGSRRRRDRLYVAEALRRPLLARWEKRTGDQRALICAQTGLAPTLIERALSSPALLKPLLGARFDELRLALHEDSWQRQVDAGGPNPVTLLKAAKDMRLDARVALQAWERAVSERETMAALTRGTPRSLDDWKRRLKDELRGL